jgi:CubicO group peptidase (beta-lactamase class C family)
VVTRERQGLEPEIDRIVAEFISPGGPGLAVLAGRGDRVLLKKGYGLADVGRAQPVRPGTRFIIASVTKQFTCLAVMLLKRRGLVGYDDPIGRYFPDFPPYRERVTLRHLMTHTSGVGEYLNTEFWQACVDGKEFTQEALVEIIRGLGELEFEPGENWRYCNSNYILLGALVEKVAGESFAAFLERHVFGPLGMRDTVVGTTGERLDGQAVGYVAAGDPGAVPEAASGAQSAFAEAIYTKEVVGWADGNIISTVEDLFTWSQALYTDRLLPLEELAEAFVPFSPHDPAFSRYGFGHIISERRGVREIHHSGSTLGYLAKLCRFPDERLTLAMLCNAPGVNLTELTGAVAEVLLGPKLGPIRAVELPGALLEEKVGRYHDPLTATAPDTPGLEVRRGPDGGPLEIQGEARSYSGCGSRPRTLVPLGRDLFRLDNRAEVYVQFLRGAESGGVSGLRLLVNGIVQNFERCGVRA